MLDLGKLKVGIEASTQDATKDIEGFGSKLSSIGSGVAKVGGVMAKGFVAGTTAMVAGATAVVGGAGALVKSLTDVSGDIQDSAMKANMSSEEFQKLKYAFEMSGMSADQLSAVAVKNQKALNDASSGAGTASDAYKNLGVSITDSNGNLKDSEAVFNETIKSLADMEDVNKRNAIANDIFGKSYGDLAPLLDGTGADIDAMKQKAVDLGIVMSNDTVSGAEALGDKFDELGMSFGGVKNGVASALLPAFTSITDGAIGVVGNLSTQLMPSFNLLGEAFEGGKIDKAKMGTAITEIMNSIVGVITEYLPMILEVGMTVLMALIGVIIDNLPMIIDSAIEVVMALVDGIMEAIPELIPAIFDAVETIVTTLLENLPEIVKMGIQLLTSLLNGIADSIPDLIPVIIDAVILITEVLLDNLPMLIEAGFKIIVAVIEGLMNALPSLLMKAPELIIKFVSSIAQSYGKMVSAGGDMIQKVVEGIGNTIGTIGTKAGEIVTKAKDAIKDKLWMITSMGSNLVTGLWNGMSDKVDWIIGKIKGFTTTVLNKIKSFFGIASPSKETAIFGKYLSEGLGIGIADNADLAIDGVNVMGDEVMKAFDNMDLTKDLSFNANANANAGLFGNDKVNPILTLDRPIVEMNVSFSGSPQENQRAVKSLETMFRDTLTGSGVQLSTSLR